MRAPWTVSQVYLESLLLVAMALPSVYSGMTAALRGDADRDGAYAAVGLRERGGSDSMDAEERRERRLS